MKGIVDDDSYLWDTEGGVHSLLSDAEDNGETLDWLDNNTVLAGEIQDAHDSSENYEVFVSDFCRKMRNIANSHGLQVPQLGEA
jgi:hypothetical protein